MCLITEHARAKRRIKELEADVAELLELLDAYQMHGKLGTERPSPADIVPQVNILADDYAKKFVIDMHQVNIPFAKPPRLLHIMEIPDTGSMDGLFDNGNTNLYFKPADEANHKIMVDWIAETWLSSQGLQTVDAVYRIMVNDDDDPNDFTNLIKKPHLWYAIHRLIEVGSDEKGRFFWFAGINNLNRDPYLCRDRNILWLSLGTVY